MRYGIGGAPRGMPEYRRYSFATRVACSYSVFLLLCVVLGMCLYHATSVNARENFWQQRQTHFESNVAAMDNTLAVLDSYTRQLTTDSSFIRFSNMKSTKDSGFFLTAYNIKTMLRTRFFVFNNLPIKESHIYLPSVDYVISGSQFTQVFQYYRYSCFFEEELYDEWLSILRSADAKERIICATPFSGLEGHYWLVRNINALLTRNVPAVIWFEWNSESVRRLFLSGDAGASSQLMILDTDGKSMLSLDGGQDNEALTDGLRALGGAGSVGDMRVLSFVSSRNGWTYLLALPEALCAAAIGNYDALFTLVGALAVLIGGVIVLLLVRQNLRPIEQLTHKLTQAEGDKAQLKAELDSQRPLLCATYVRRVLSGHVGSEDELRYIMRYLRLEGQLRFMALYAVVYNQEGAFREPSEMYALLEEKLTRYLQTEYPVYYYATLDSSYVVLVTYPESQPEPLMDLQNRVLRLHDELLETYSLWFYTGVGETCVEPIRLWESYEQARAAARYTAKDHIFLPYEMIRKESGSVYYPVEISAKLQHFITTDNRAQVMELFALIHRENVEERSLPVNLFNFLLSDIKNTLLRARFSIPPQEAERRAELLAQMDEKLGALLTFALCESIALQLCEFFSESAEPSDPIPEIKAYLREHFTDPSMCLSKLSDRFRISESYLSHLYKERTGQNFSAYLEELRLDEAARRLRGESAAESGKEPGVSTLYLELGYNNATTFRRAFKKRFGVTPSDMRAMAK